ncbi:hypothetical protein VIM7927_00514 [Vibrio mangrovi]|uniref:Uncharacterized protein n=1 Tax=Vibrio mangrovi TaxID=474394 RepID=A0A1Y6INP7_9VIBR|nr:hypothetical protein VIM7927_00514 [Vibrio mangrovi]
MRLIFHLVSFIEGYELFFLRKIVLQLHHSIEVHF